MSNELNIPSLFTDGAYEGTTIGEIHLLRSDCRLGHCTCAGMFTTEVQFGHVGSMVNSDAETADAKNRAMREAGSYERLVKTDVINPRKERDILIIPMDYKWTQELGLIRKPAI